MWVLVAQLLKKKKGKRDLPPPDPACRSRRGSAGAVTPGSDRPARRVRGNGAERAPLGWVGGFWGVAGLKGEKTFLAGQIRRFFFFFSSLFFFLLPPLALRLWCSLL